MTILALLGLSLSFAQIPLFQTGQTVDPVALLEFVDEPLHFLFVGRNDQFLHVFDVKDGNTRELPSANQHDQYGSLDLLLSDRRRLVVPAEEAHPGHRGSRVPYLIHPDRPRDELRTVELTIALARFLDLVPLVKSLPPSAPASPVRRVPASGVVLLLAGSDLASVEEMVRDAHGILIRDGRLPAGARLSIVPAAQVASLRAKLAHAGESVRVDAISREGISFYPPMSFEDALRDLTHEATDVPRKLAAVLSVTEQT